VRDEEGWVMGGKEGGEVKRKLNISRSYLFCCVSTKILEDQKRFDFFTKRIMSMPQTQIF